jgi:hypothetical protein
VAEKAIAGIAVLHQQQQTGLSYRLKQDETSKNIKAPKIALRGLVR